MGGLNTYVKQGVPQCLCYIGGGGGLNTYVLWGGGGGSSILNTYLILGGLNTYVVQGELLNAYVKQGVPQCLCYIGGGAKYLRFMGGSSILNTYLILGGLNTYVVQGELLNAYVKQGVPQCLCYMGGGGAKYLRFMGGFLNPQYLPNIGGSQYLRSTGGVTQCLRKTRGPQCLCYIGGGGGLNTYVLWGGGSSILNTYLILGVSILT